MVMSLLEICQEALEEIGVDPPTTIVSGGDLGAQLMALANSTGRDIAKRHDWQALSTEGNFTTVATNEQCVLTTTFPYLRRIKDNTMWNRTQQRRIIGPMSPQAWNRIAADSITPSTLNFYIRGNSLLFPGTPVAGESVYFEYIDKRWCSNSGVTSYYQSFQADTDIPRLDDYAFVLGVRWRFLKKKGLEYGEEFREYEDWIELCKGSDTPKQTVNVNPYQGSEGFDQQIPEGNWNL
jgi:hypothetical protein